MRLLSDLASRLGSLWSAVRGRGEDRELEEEMRFHLDSEAERLRRSGMSAGEARRMAHVRFGGVERMRERTREARGMLWLETLWTDVRVAHRAILRTPGQSLAAVLTLGLGIGVATTQFGTLYSAFYRQLPFDDAEHYVWIWQMNERGDRLPASPHDFEEWRDGSRSLRDIAADWTGPVGLRTATETWQLGATRMTWNAFDVVGAQPMLGRAFGPEDDRPGSPLVAVVSQRVWEERFASDPNILGRDVAVNGEPATIIGVMPEGFQFPIDEDLWLPLRVDASLLARGDGPRLSVFGHLDEGVSLDVAQSDLSRLAAAATLAHPETNAGLGVVVYDYLAEVGPEAFLINWMLMAGALAVLFIACVNVANLLLARAAVRTREVALRSALGARRGQIMLHVLSESAALALYGSLLGAVLGWAGVRGIAYAMSSVDGQPYWMRFEVDGVVMLFVALAAAASGVVTGLVPALRATAGDVAPLLKDGSRGSTGLRIGRLSRALVGGEVAFSVAVLVATGLMSRSAVRLAGYDLPFDKDGVLAAEVDLFASEEGMSDRREEALHEAVDRLAESPGIEAVALANSVPGLFAGRGTVEVEGVAYPTEQDIPLAHSMVVSADFFALMNVAPVTGRTFETSDDEESLPVAIVNESFVRSHFGDADPVGRRVRVGNDGNAPALWRTVVGVVPDLLMQGLVNVSYSTGEGVYVPTTQSGVQARTLLVRTAGAPLASVEEVRSLLRSVDPDLGIVQAATLDDRVHRSSWYIRITALIFMVFGVAALFLACVGLAGVVAFESERRTKEVGVRMALGARARDVAGMIVGQGVRQVALGVVVGLVLALGLARGLTLVMFETDPNDPLLYAAAGVVVLLVSALASLYPALRAARSDPVKSLQA